MAWRGSEKMAISALMQVHFSNSSLVGRLISPSILGGIRLTTSKWVRPSPNSAPTDSKAAGLYMICSLSKHEAEKDGFDDTLMLDYRGFIAEATGANIFHKK